MGPVIKIILSKKSKGWGERKKERRKQKWNNEVKQSTLTTTYQSLWSYRCFSLHLHTGIWWLFRLCPVPCHPAPPPPLINSMALTIAVCVSLWTSKAFFRLETKRWNCWEGGNVNLKKFISYSKLSSKNAFSIYFFSNSVQEYITCYSSGKPAVINLFTFCANLMCEKWGLVIILVCFPLITSKAVHLYRLAICFFSANYSS